MPYRWLLFDADDTLFDYQIAEEKSLQRAFALNHIPFSPVFAATYRTINHAYWAQFEAGTIGLEDLRVRRFADLFATHGITADPIVFSEIYLSGLGLVADLIPGVLETITQLQVSHHLAIITNGITQVQYARLSRTPIAKFFKHVFISEEIGISKPAAGFFDFVFQTIGNPPKEEVLVIGDSLSSDMAGGFNFGLDTCWFNPRRLEKPDHLPITYEIQSIPQILDIVA